MQEGRSASNSAIKRNPYKMYGDTINIIK